MQAVVLAAGKGTRMYPLTLDKPKPLVEVVNKPVLELNLDQMLGLIEEVIIIVGYKKDMIMERFGNNYMGMKLTYVVQEEQLGTGHALLQAENKIKGRFLVLNGDDLYSRKDMVSLSRYPYCILVKKEKDASTFAAVVVEDGLVKDIVEKPKTFVSDLVNVGMYCFEKEVFQILKKLKKSERGEYEITEAVKELAQQGRVHYEEVKGYWIPVGYPWHLLDATEELLEENGEMNIKGKLEEGVVVEGSIDIGEGTIVGKGTLLKGTIIIGRNCRIGQNCVITGFTALGDSCDLAPDVKLDNVIIGPGSKLEKNCVIKDSVLGEKAFLSKNIRIEKEKKGETVKVNGNGCCYDSGREKLGVFVSDGTVVSKKKLSRGECFSPK